MKLKHLSIYIRFSGPPGIGKTSALRHFEKIMNDLGFTTVQSVDFGRETSLRAAKSKWNETT